MTKQWHGGKGSQRRNADDKAYGDNWDLIFGNKNQKIKQKQLTELNWDGEEDGDEPSEISKEESGKEPKA
tara:strand:+ start:4524 stop:4733 length:210 start_codon:yes stop_codon:yes gene_type:complete